MNILIITSNNQVASEVKETISNEIIGANFEVAVDISHARYQVKHGNYQLIIIDMVVQEFFGMDTKPILQSPIAFIKKIKSDMPQLKVFALFNESETGKKGQEDVKILGYEVGNYSFILKEWRNKLKKYIH